MIDAHVHYWQVDRGDYGWLTPDLPICRDFGPADAAPLFAASGVTGIVLVQAAPTEAETRFLLSVAAQDVRVRGVVGWIDMMRADAPDRLAALAQDRMLRAIRPMWQDIPEDDWMLRREQDPAYRAVVELGLAFDALARVRHLPHIPRLIERHPNLPIVIDHGAKPDIQAGALAPWRAGMATIASFPHVRCKLSGLFTEAGPGADCEDLRPYVETLLELFGPERLIFGSDWPVLTLRSDYLTWWDCAHRLTSHLTRAEQDSVFGANATAFYRLPDA
ncbi:MAG TPA: amidohydrolase family protein [Acetobacteraceae bacterium]|nr:amidohydrolase family protein [Acetobacteraceae bacterium]